MEYKRHYRDCPDEVKKKISAALQNKPKSTSHRQHISDGLKDYWKSVPSINDTVYDRVEVDGCADD